MNQTYAMEPALIQTLARHMWKAYSAWYHIFFEAEKQCFAILVSLQLKFQLSVYEPWKCGINQYNIKVSWWD